MALSKFIFYGYDADGKLCQQEINATHSYRATKMVKEKRPEVNWEGYTENETT